MKRHPPLRLAVRPAGLLATGGCMLLLLALGACRQPGARPSQQRPLDLILVSCDTLRADAAYDPELAPNLAALRRESRTYLDAFAPAPHTLPSHMTMLTGLPPEVHGVWGRGEALSPAATTLAERLAAAGYETHGVVTNEWIDASFGFGRGFDSYSLLPHAATYSDRVFAAGLELLDRRRDERPLFLFLHTFDPHSDFEAASGSELPYYAPPTYLERLAPDLAPGRFRLPDGRGATDWLIAVDTGAHAATPDDRAVVRGLYRSGVRFLDDQLGELVAALRARGALDRALLVVTADHGEELGDHGLIVHSQVHQEVVAVPLVVRHPAGLGAGAEDARPIGLEALMSMVLGELGVARGDASDAGGTARLPTPRAGGPWALARERHRERYALRDGGESLLVTFSADGETEIALYDRSRDRTERENVAAARPDRVAALLAVLRAELAERRRWQRTAGLAPVAGGDREGLDPEARARLRALGYAE